MADSVRGAWTKLWKDVLASGLLPYTAHGPPRMNLIGGCCMQNPGDFHRSRMIVHRKTLKHFRKWCEIAPTAAIQHLEASHPGIRALISEMKLAKDVFEIQLGPMQPSSIATINSVRIF